MKKINTRYISLILILLSVVFSFYFLIGRYRAESHYKGYDIVADYNQFLKLAYQNQSDVDEYFKELKENGVTTIVVVESTIDSMKSNPVSKLSTEMDGVDLIVKGTRDELDFIAKGLDVLKTQREITRVSNTELRIQGRPEDIVTLKTGAFDIEQNKIGDVGIKSSILEYVGLGFDSNTVEHLKSLGINVNLRPIFYSRIQDSQKTMQRFMNAVEELNPEQRWIVFSGTEFYSNRAEDQNINEEFIKWLSEKKIALGLIEASNQRGHITLRGVDPVIKNNNVKKVRAFTTWDYLQTRYDYQLPMHRNGQELTNVYYRAISERNISVVFISSYIKDNAIISDPQMYGNVLKPLAQRMDQKGYTSGDVNPMGDWNPSRIFKIPVALGVVAAGVILLELMFNISQMLSIIIFAAGALFTLVFFGIGIKENTGSLLFNLAGIVIYPSLAIAVILQSYTATIKNKIQLSTFKIYLQGMLLLLVAIIITMIGALNEISFLSGTNFLMELVEFRGVKISQLLPIVIALFLYAAYVGFGRVESSKPKIQLNEIQNIFNSNVKLWQAGVAVVLLGIVGIFLLRGGNTNASIPGIELLIRNLMEIYLPVRPRTKAILICWPAIILLMYIANRKKGQFLTLVLTLFAAIGLADIVNTFSHIRTPLYISFTRIVVQFVIVAILSIIYVYIIEIIRKGFNRIIGK